MLVCAIPDLACQSQGLLGNIASVLEAGVVVGWGLCHRLEKW